MGAKNRRRAGVGVGGRVGGGKGGIDVSSIKILNRQRNAAKRKHNELLYQEKLERQQRREIKRRERDDGSFIKVQYTKDTIDTINRHKRPFSVDVFFIVSLIISIVSSSLLFCCFCLESASKAIIYNRDYRLFQTP